MFRMTSIDSLRTKQVKKCLRGEHEFTEVARFHDPSKNRLFVMSWCPNCGALDRPGWISHLGPGATPCWKDVKRPKLAWLVKQVLADAVPGGSVVAPDVAGDLGWS